MTDTQTIKELDDYLNDVSTLTATMAQRLVTHYSHKTEQTLSSLIQSIALLELEIESFQDDIAVLMGVAQDEMQEVKGNNGKG